LLCPVGSQVVANGFGIGLTSIIWFVVARD
jgi:hypothetical protein